jgi:light-regulated signal transduction histidine kinase (bacteriophytochrome)
LNRQLLENIARLESANRDLDRFAFMASHDLQEPLRKIRTFSDLLFTKFDNSLDSDAKLHVMRIQKAAERMQALIKDIFTFSKISDENGIFEKTDLNLVVKEVLDELDMVIREKKAHVVLELLPSLEVNPVLMRPLFSNLIGNALKYTKKDVVPVITIRSEVQTKMDLVNKKTKSDKYCQIYIQDNGIGFEQQYAEQIFDMFRRLHLSSEFEGTGIGLALCKKIVEKHNGYISALSQLDKGSTFIVSLPFVQMRSN